MADETNPEEKPMSPKEAVDSWCHTIPVHRRNESEARRHARALEKADPRGAEQLRRYAEVSSETAGYFESRAEGEAKRAEKK